MPLYDPCCGTGTLLIEAAFKATSRAPGLTRSFACESYPFMDRAGMEALRREAREAFRPDAPLSIAGSDIDPEALTLCGRHIRQAGLEGRVRVHRQDLKTLTLEGPAGVFLLNPPYGERLSDREGARALYRELGLLIRRHPPAGGCAPSPPIPDLSAPLAAARIKNAGCTTADWNAISSCTSPVAKIDFPAAVRYHKPWIMPPFGRFHTQVRRMKACRF